MKLMIALEFASTGAEEMSLFQRLSAGNGTNPFRLALCPRLIPLQLGGGFPPLVEVTCKFCDADVALPGLGFITATANAPAVDSFPVAVSCADDTKVVASGAPARRTCAPLTNPLPFTVIAKAPAGTEVGAMPVSTGTGFCNETVLVLVAVVSAELTARMVTVLEPGTVAGAEYKPDELIVPVAAVPPATPFTCQITEAFDNPVTVALKDFVAPARTLALGGATATVTLDPEGGVLELEGDELFVVPVHPASAAAASRNTETKECRKANFLHLSIRKHTESAPLRRRIACTGLCLGVSRGTTVRKDKIGRGTPEQDGHVSKDLAFPFGNGDGLSGPASPNSGVRDVVIRILDRS
jgi:hypothetical protein